MKYILTPRFSIADGIEVTLAVAICLAGHPFIALASIFASAVASVFLEKRYGVERV